MLLSSAGQHVAELLGRSGDSDFVQQAQDSAEAAYEFIKAYTRGRGFGPENPGHDPEEPDAIPPDIRAVIITAAARLVTNPAQLEREEYDQYLAVGAFHGFSLAEFYVLNRWRRRTA